MKQTKLIEFNNQKNEILRGILVIGEKIRKVVIMCGGFERSATTEKKFKLLADELIKQDIASLRFDYTGCGLSDGDFTQTTIKRMGNDFKNAYKILEKEYKDISVIAHSLSAPITALLNNNLAFTKIILIAPALNQEELLRYWFVVSSMKEETPNLQITWQNYKKYLDEEKFQADCARTNRMTKINYINVNYYLENKDKDYSDLLIDKNNILHIHGDNDDKTPTESVNVKYKNKIIVKNGDHELERPDMMEQWLDKAVNFIKGINL